MNHDGLNATPRARLLVQEIDARQQTRAVARPIHRARHGQRRVVLDLDRQLGRRQSQGN